MNKHYFNSIEEAEKFIKVNNIKDYHFQTPEYLENGVDLVIHLTREQAVNIMVEHYGWSKQSAKFYVDMHKSTKDIEWNKITNYKNKGYFMCEICQCFTPIECEGSEPNTCAECMPINIEERGDDNGYN